MQAQNAKMIHAGFYTGGNNEPAARFRARQYQDALLHFGVRMYEHPSRVGRYPPSQKWLRPAWLAAALLERGVQAPASHRFDVVVFQRELVSTLVTLEPIFGRPQIMDVDDAIWLHRRGAFARRLAERVEAVICGNAYLADYFAQFNRRVTILPTAVDVERFRPRDGGAPGEERLVIGWSGTSSNLVYLEDLEPALRRVMKRFNNAELRVVCDRPPRFSTLPAERVEFVRWSPEVEVSAVQDLAVGLMPMRDTAWARGKCAFKMLTYMACGVPVVASPVGMNAQVLSEGQVGLGAGSEDEWVNAISEILADREAARQMGATGRAVVKSRYSVDVLAGKLAAVLKEVAG